ncbi:hypothetical protein ADK67_01265 [Saccharothrix sp. NRRL B-16348]|uniref:hypothetical protein n=1 Tax=Saccharothrix sp. NRRL B-16348 TaxID=1415542 RepID=UPI0006B03F6A|nr:hypothetical protein [Saccharothrix sp. NRRL B-16348]KOX35143.1 hypothetical protein ADK67_01265 [Saccharothrix sp. NRRL B-16348]
MKFNRDQVVAASLVGTVVVVLGFASGLGRPPTVAADQQSTAHPPQDHVTGTADPADPPPAVHVGQPQRHQGTAVPPVHPDPTHPNPVHPEPNHPDPTTPPTTPPITKPPTQPPCDVDAISALLAGLGALVDGLPLVSDLTGALPLLIDTAALTDTGALGALTGTLGSLGGLLGGATPTPLTGPLAGVLPTGAPGGLQPGTAVGGVGGLPDLAGVVGTATSTGALPISGTNNAQLNGLLGDRCGLLVQPGDGRVVGLLSTP